MTRWWRWSNESYYVLNSLNTTKRREAKTRTQRAKWVLSTLRNYQNTQHGTVTRSKMNLII